MLPARCRGPEDEGRWGRLRVHAGADACRRGGGRRPRPTSTTQPRWATVGDNVTDTVAQFFKPSKDNWDGAWGLSFTFPDTNKQADECNEIVERRSGISFPHGSDGFGFTAVTCLQFLALADALAKVQGPLTEQKAIAALEGLGTVPSAHGPTLTLSAAKHAGGDHVYLSRYSKKTEKFEPVDDAKPLSIS